jgi:hypothetical protein
MVREPVHSTFEYLIGGESVWWDHVHVDLVDKAGFSVLARGGLLLRMVNFG